MAVRGVNFCRLTIKLCRFQMHPGQCSDPFQMTGFFGSDVYQEILGRDFGS
jgi:hypothetical protein